MTFREKIAADLKEMSENCTREMPSGFSPDELWLDDENRIVVRHAAPPAGHIRLGFLLTDNKRQNSMAMRALYQSVWQVLEFVRLGQAEKIEAMGGVE